MPIVLQDQSGIAQGIGTAGQAIASGLEKRAQNRLMRQQREQQREGLDAVLDWASQYDASRSPMENLGTLSSSLEGKNVDPSSVNQILQKIVGGEVASAAKTPATDPVLRSNYNSNQKLIAGIQHDARKADSLLRESEGVLEAIESGDVRGQGLKGVGTSMWRFLSGRGTSRDEQTLDTIRKRFLVEMGDLKGIRLTDTKLRMMEDSLFAPGKSQEANLEAYRLFVNTLRERSGYAKKVKSILGKNPNALYDSDFGIQLEETLEDLGPTESMSFDAQQQSNAQQQFNSLPDPSQYVGKKIRNDESGEIYISDGTTWKRAE